MLKILLTYFQASLSPDIKSQRVSLQAPFYHTQKPTAGQ